MGSESREAFHVARALRLNAEIVSGRVSTETPRRGAVRYMVRSWSPLDKEGQGVLGITKRHQLSKHHLTGIVESLPHTTQHA